MQESYKTDRYGAKYLLLALVACFCSSPANAQPGQAGSLVGRWHYKSAQQEITIDFMPNGFFLQLTRTTTGQEELRGHYVLHGEMLELLPNGYFLPDRISCRFAGADMVVLTYPKGRVIRARRVKIEDEPKPQVDVPPPASGEPVENVAPKPAQILLERISEPGEKAFSVLVPKGWKTAGGVFKVNELQMNGPGNSVAPKCDFAVGNDDAGTVMVRWLPGWNYADLTYSRSAGQLRPGRNYQGMMVKPILNAKQFLTETLTRERPQASDFRIIAEDVMPEVTAAYARQAALVNSNLRKSGIAPMQFDSLAMIVEYVEGGRRYREAIRTTIVDNRGPGSQWSNENTVVFRAPAAEFDSWKPVLDAIQVSRRFDPEWLDSVEKAAGERAKIVLETEDKMSSLANGILQMRANVRQPGRFEHWLFAAGEDYRNPFTGDVEHGISSYRFRWVNRQGEVAYSDDEGFNPNRFERLQGREWKPAPTGR